MKVERTFKKVIRIGQIEIDLAAHEEDGGIALEISNQIDISFEDVQDIVKLGEEIRFFGMEILGQKAKKKVKLLGTDE